jgi:N-acyl homoserine lactone hydrolase
MRTKILAPVLALAAACLGGSAAAAEGLRLYAMDCGRISLKDADMFADDGAYKGVPKSMVVPCYLIRHPKGDLIWDTGIPESTADKPASEGGEALTMKRKLTDQLKDLGLAPADIEYLSISHSHFDHIGNAGLFARSTWIVDPDEKAYAFRPEARKDAKGFAAYSALEGAKTVAVEGDAPHDVFGDGSVQVVPTPGHTPGHTVLLVRLPKAGAVLLTGDMWHVAESRAARRVPRFNVDRTKTLASMDRIEALAAKEKARVIRQHVPEDFEALPTFPAALE